MPIIRARRRLRFAAVPVIALVVAAGATAFHTGPAGAGAPSKGGAQPTMRSWVTAVCTQLDDQIRLFRGWQGDIARLAGQTSSTSLSSSDLTAVRLVTAPVVLRLQSATFTLRAIGPPPRAAGTEWWQQYRSAWATLSRGLTQYHVGISALIPGADTDPVNTTTALQTLGAQFAEVRSALPPALAALDDDPSGAAFLRVARSVPACRSVRHFSP